MCKHLVEWEGSFLGCGKLYLSSVLPSPQSCSSGRKWELLTESRAMAFVQKEGQEGAVSLEKDIWGAKAGARLG